ncbi:IS630 family transposase [Streptomyces djakartensis]|uniref:IS630 family transposase n=1 Tax=Streptomyces djakartensis TaxID=68193 RepID=UPI0034DF965B
MRRARGRWVCVPRVCGVGIGCGREGGVSALRPRAATGRPPKLDDAQVETMRAALARGAQAYGFEADLWTLERVGTVVERVTGVVLSRASVWRLLTGRLGWSLQRPERRAVERDESEIARWIALRVAANQKGAVNTRAWIVFLDESGVSLLPQIRRTYAPRGRTPLLRHRLSWKRASMAGVLGYHTTDPDRGARLCFHLKLGSYDTTAFFEVLGLMKAFHRSEQVVLVWDGLSAHWSRAMRAWVAEQDWLTLERLPAYGPELNPVQLLWASLKKGVNSPTSPATTSLMSSTPPNKFSTASTTTHKCHGPSSPTPA